MKMGDNRGQNTAQLTLAEILSQPSLGLHLVTSDTSVLARPVTGAHSFEISRPTRWSSAHWIALTTGLRLKGRPEEQRELVAELHQAGITALGFALDINFRAVPVALMEAAEEYGLPVFTVPFATGFAEIIAFVNQALLSPNVNALRRFVSVQDYLLDALLSQDAVRSLIHRLAPLIPADVALLDTSGELVASSDALSEAVGAEIVARLGSELTSSGRGGTPPKTSGKRTEHPYQPQLSTLTQLIEFSTSAGPALAIAVVSPTQAPLWLALVKTLDSPSEPGFNLSLPLIRSAGHILSIALETRSDKKAEHRATQRALIAELCGIKPAKGLAPRGSRSTLEHLYELGIDFSRPVYVACASATRDLAMGAHVYLDDRLDNLGDPGAPVIWDIHSEHAVVITQCDPAALETLLLDTFGGSHFSFGVSAPVSSVGNFPECYREACAALVEVMRFSHNSADQSRASQITPRVLHFSNCSMVTWLIAQADEKLLLEKQTERQGQLAFEKTSVITVRAYLESNLDINRGAATLGIHPNSMRYRLNKVRESHGIDLENFSELVDLYLALRVSPPI